MVQGIRSCPFCGKHDIEINLYNDRYALHCKFCGIIGPMAVNSELAILKWNSRIQEAPKMSYERPQIIDRYNARNFICPFRDTSNDKGCSQ